MIDNILVGLHQPLLSKCVLTGEMDEVWLSNKSFDPPYLSWRGMSSQISGGQENSYIRYCSPHQILKCANRIREFLKIFFSWVMNFNMHDLFYKSLFIFISHPVFHTNPFVKSEVCTSVLEKQYGNNRHLLKFMVLRSTTVSSNAVVLGVLRWWC